MSWLVDLAWRVAYFPVWTLLHVLFRLRREGPRLPKGPILLAPNHCSFVDPAAIQMTSWRHLSFLMTEVFYRPWPVRWFFAWMRAIPVKEGRGNRDALGAAVEALRAGWAVCVFPEGQIATDGRLQRFHPGIAALAEQTGAPVIPVAVIGSYEAYPRRARFPKLFRPITVRFGAPIPPPAPRGDDASRKAMLREYTDRVRQGVVALLEPRQLPHPASAGSREMAAR